jgi:hypothetical protein
MLLSLICLQALPQSVAHDGDETTASPLCSQQFPAEVQSDSAAAAGPAAGPAGPGPFCRCSQPAARPTATALVTACQYVTCTVYILVSNLPDDWQYSYSRHKKRFP